MSDDIDRAVDMGDKMLQASIDSQRRKAQTRQVSPSGLCHYCNCQVNRGQVFCDSMCSEDYDAEQDAKRRNGDC